MTPAAQRTPAQPSAARLNLVILAVDDLDRARNFYESAFGWDVAVDVPVYVEFALPGGAGIGVYLRNGFAVNTGVPPARCPAAATTSTELYLRVPDLGAAVARLRDLGARELSPPAPRDWGDTAAYFADPDGNVVAVAVATPRE